MNVIDLSPDNSANQININNMNNGTSSNSSMTSMKIGVNINEKVSFIFNHINLIKKIIL